MQLVGVVAEATACQLPMDHFFRRLLQDVPHCQLRLRQHLQQCEVIGRFNCASHRKCICLSEHNSLDLEESKAGNLRFMVFAMLESLPSSSSSVSLIIIVPRFDSTKVLISLFIIIVPSSSDLCTTVPAKTSLLNVYKFLHVKKFIIDAQTERECQTLLRSVSHGTW